MKAFGLEKYTRFDKRIVWVIWLLLMVIALVRPIGFPGAVSDYVRIGYNYIDSLPPGTIVYSGSLGGGSTSYLDGNQYPCQVAVLNMLSKGHFRIVFIGNVDAVNQFEFCTDPAKKQIDFSWAKYGIDYVILGPATTEPTWAGFFNDLWGYSRGVDMYGNKLSDLPLMAEVHTAKDFKFAYYHAGAESLFDPQIRQLVIPYRVPMIMTGPDAMAGYGKIFVQSGDLISWFTGASGGAEFERLSGLYRQGTMLQDAYALTVIFFIAIIILANVPLLTKSRGGIKV